MISVFFTNLKQNYERCQHHQHQLHSVKISSEVLFFRDKTNYRTFSLANMSTASPRYSRTIYLRIRFFTFKKMVQNDKFPVKNGLFICDFKIRGPK